MRGRDLWVPLGVVLALLTPSCGLAENARGESSPAAKLPHERSSSLERPGIDGSEQGETRQGGGLSIPESESDGEPVAGESDGEPVAGASAPPETTDTGEAPPSSDLPSGETGGPLEGPAVSADLSPEERLAVDRCIRIGAFKSAGYAVYKQSMGREAILVEWVEAVLDGFEGLVPVVSPAGYEILQSLLEDVEPTLSGLVDRPPDASVAELQALTDRIGPRMTQLMLDLRNVCPAAISDADISAVERVQLGTDNV